MVICLLIDTWFPHCSTIFAESAEPWMTTPYHRHRLCLVARWKREELVVKDKPFPSYEHNMSNEIIFAMIGEFDFLQL